MLWFSDIKRKIILSFNIRVSHLKEQYKCKTAEALKRLIEIPLFDVHFAYPFLDGQRKIIQKWNNSDFIYVATYICYCWLNISTF